MTNYFKKSVILALIATFNFAYNSTPVSAVSTPSYPSCSNPQGDIKANYPTGTHGIVGETATHTGSDTVYKLTDDTLAQCFCSDSGEGIQTNWWKISQLTDAEIQILKNEGWIYVPTGVVWGLDDASYMAKNLPYSCRNGNGSGDKVGGSSDSNSGSSVGGVIAASTQAVLGLASTGNIGMIYSLVGLGLTSFVLGVLLRKK